MWGADEIVYAPAIAAAGVPVEAISRDARLMAPDSWPCRGRWGRVQLRARPRRGPRPASRALTGPGRPLRSDGPARLTSRFVTAAAPVNA